MRVSNEMVECVFDELHDYLTGHPSKADIRAAIENALAHERDGDWHLANLRQVLAEHESEAEARIAELDAAIKHADSIVDQLTAERDAALERAEKAEIVISKAPKLNYDPEDNGVHWLAMQLVLDGHE